MAVSTAPRVLVLVCHFPPLDSAGFSIRTVKWLKYLAQDGWRPTVVTVDPGRPAVAAEARTSRFLLDELPSNIDIVRVPALVTMPSAGTLAAAADEGGGASERPSFMPGMIGLTGALGRMGVKNLMLPDLYATWALPAARRAVAVGREMSADLVFATCPPYSNAPLGRFVARSLKRPLVLEFRDDWLGAPRIASLPAWLRHAHRRLERRAIRSASRVIAVTPESMASLTARYPADPSRFCLIPNGADLGEFAGLRADRQPNPQFTIAGEFRWKERSPETLYGAVGQLLRRRPELRGLIRIRAHGPQPHAAATDLERWGVTDIVERSSRCRSSTTLPN